MARISGVDIPKQKRGVIALTYIFGIGRSRAKNILEMAKVSVDKKVSEWNDDDTAKIREAVGTFKIEGELRSENQINIKRLMDIGCYRGIPLRGQKTKNNSRTRKGKRKTVANKKKVTK
jgi:small subunit ribosomal protein S13